MQKKISKQSFMQAVRFCIVGVLNTLVDYGVFYVLLSLLHMNKGVAQVFATGSAMCGSFFVNRFWTFGRHGKGNIGEIAKFIVTNLVAMAVVILLTYLFYDIWHVEMLTNRVLAPLGVSFRLRGNVAVMFCKILASAFSVLINFLGNKFWVFKEMPEKETEW